MKAAHEGWPADSRNAGVTMDAVVAVGATLTLGFGALMAGAYYAFSVAVIPGLSSVSAQHAVPAMRGMNDKILNPLFLLTFVGAPLAPLVTGVLLWIDGQGGAATAFLLAGASVVAGAFLPTVAVNVPLNERLDKADGPSDTAEAERLWTAYAPRWRAWNTFRALASTLGVLLAGLGIHLLS